MIIKILCLLGYHEWNYTFSNVRVCWHCLIKEGIYDEKQNNLEEIIVEENT